SEMECPESGPLQLLQHNDAKFLACDLSKRDLETCRRSLQNTCQNPIRVYANNRQYLVCEIKESLPEWSQPAKLSATLPKIKCKKENLCTAQWQGSANKYCVPSSTQKESSEKDLNGLSNKKLKFRNEAQKGSSEKDLYGLVTKKFKYKPEAIKRAVLRETNKYRKLHRASPLKMSKKISSYAQSWAEQLAYNDRLETRPFPIYGENIMCTRKPIFSIEHMMKLWYQEKYHYDYMDPCFSPYTGHFTQMVWRNTEYLGVGVASNDCCIWIVCNYDPPGNTRGHFQENVLPRSLLFHEATDEEEEVEVKKKKKKIR
ncbi:hypothetical protein KR054_007741, partial [Drosophila jambulina]